MSKVVIIPDCMRPAFEVTINGRKYKYPSGTECEVPDDVAAVIESHINSHRNEPEPVPEQPSLGGADWNASEGEPGHVLNRTHYENGTEIKTLLDATVTVANNQFQGAGVVPLTVGNTYTVIWDGTEYECVCIEVEFSGAPAPALGNPYFLGGENNGLPFLFGSLVNYGRYAGATMTNGDHTIKITEEVKAYKKLDECYLPSGLTPYILNVYSISLEDGVPSTPTVNIAARFDIVAETLWNGGRVVLDFTNTELKNEGIYKAEVVEWWLRPQANGTNDIVLWYLYKGNPTSYCIIGGTWTPPTT